MVKMQWVYFVWNLLTNTERASHECQATEVCSNAAEPPKAGSGRGFFRFLLHFELKHTLMPNGTRRDADPRGIEWSVPVLKVKI